MSSDRIAPRARGAANIRVEVGHMHGVKPGNIVGAIANEAELDSKHIGRITIREDHTLIDLPEGMPSEILGLLKKTWVAGQRLRISRGTAGDPNDSGDANDSGGRPPRAGKPSYPRSGGGGSGKPRGPRKPF